MKKNKLCTQRCCHFVQITRNKKAKAEAECVRQSVTLQRRCHAMPFHAIPFGEWMPIVTVRAFLDS